MLKIKGFTLMTRDSIGRLKCSARAFFVERWPGVWMEMLQLTAYSVEKRLIAFYKLYQSDWYWGLFDFLKKIY